MKKLAKKLYKRQCQGSLVNEAEFLGSVENFEWFIRTGLLAHANRMNMYTKMTKHSQKAHLVKHLRENARVRLSTWIYWMRNGIVRHL